VGAGTESCQQRYWTNGRFAPEVVAANSQAVGVLKDWFGASELTLVGYSGGAAIAAMVAAVRQDVSRLVTVAGNLDHRAWTAYQRVQPLSGSLNAVDFASALAHVSQMHFVGAEDKVIPPALALEWGEGLLGAAGANLRIKRGFDHHCCWVQQWPSLWDELPE
jgi:predicted esterase